MLEASLFLLRGSYNLFEDDKAPEFMCNYKQRKAPRVLKVLKGTFPVVPRF